MDIVSKIKSSKWKEIIANCNPRTCSEYKMKLWSESFNPNIDEDSRASFSFLSDICSMFIKSDVSGNYLLEPFMTVGERPSFHPKFLEKEDADVLFDWISELDDMVIKARIADIIWMNKGKNRLDAAKISIETYRALTDFYSQDSNNLLENSERCDCYGRGMTIAVGLGSVGFSELNSVLQKALGFIYSFSVENGDGSLARLLRYICNFDLDDTTLLYEKCGELAKAARGKVGYILTRSFLECQLQLSKRDSEKIREIKHCIAETYVFEAEERPDSPLVQSFFLKDAIEQHRRNENRERADELYKLLLSHQKAASDQLHIFEAEGIDIHDIVIKAESHVADRPLIDALMRLAFIIKPLDIPAMAEKSKKEAQERTIFQLVTPVLLNENGATESIPKSLKSDENNSAAEVQLAENIGIHIHYAVTASLIPAIRRVNADHGVSEMDVLGFIRGNPFVSPGHERFFSRSIVSGFQFDFADAMVFLIPQIENSLRFIVEQNDGLSSHLNSDKTQSVKLLDTLLALPLLEEILGVRNIEILRRILTDPRVGNLRNSVAHGFIKYDSLSSTVAIYLWWFILRLLMSQVRIISLEEDNSLPKGGAPNSSSFSSDSI